MAKPRGHGIRYRGRYRLEKRVGATARMKIIDILSIRPTLSFEFFPPKTPAGVSSLFRTINNLKRFTPDFVSMTYGAGGSTKVHD